MENTIEIKAADTLLEHGVRVRMGKRRSLVFRQPRIGTLLAISKEFLKMGVDIEKLDGGSVEEAHRLFLQNGRAMARIAAIGWLGSRIKIRLLTSIVSRHLQWRLTPQQLRDIMLLLVTLSGVQDFTNTIRLVQTMTLTAPKNLSPEESGS
ncbi:hypothetical protein AGMMS4956_14150 [Bacteroidia bacterium]|nr:hypothetical protein AGMMS4956_14150 [Bacteroidia bacterium]